MRVTRLRYISAKSIDEIMLAVSSLTFKIEIKGAPVLKGGRWFLFFVLPESPSIDFKSVNL